MAHPIQGLMEASMKNIKEMVDVNTIIGDPVETPDGTTIIPVSRVSFGFGAGGSNIPVKVAETSMGEDAPFGGGSGAGVSIRPVGFLVVGAEQIKLLPVEEGASAPMDKLFEFLPKMVEKVNSLISNNKKKSDKEDGED